MAKGLLKKNKQEKVIEKGDPFIGKLFNDRYEIVRKVGKGSYGAVYACRDYYLGNSIVALKILHPKVLRYANAAKRLAQEIQAANRIDHENIVRFYDFFRCNDLCAITMEFINGPSLRNYIEENAPFDYTFITEVLRQICTGLQAIHNHDIIHRDMKPDNILLADGWNAKITDFGIAYLIDGNDEYSSMKADNQNSTGTGTGGTKKKQLVGTMRYISPESIEFGQYDKRSDIYAVGVILYEMLIGKYFFTYKNASELMNIKIKFDPDSPATIRRDCPLMMEKICVKALQRNPENRYQSTEEILEDIRILRSELSGADFDPTNALFVVPEQNLLPPPQRDPLKKLKIAFIFLAIAAMVGCCYLLFVEFKSLETPPTSVIETSNEDLPKDDSPIKITVGKKS
ncbi:MAG: serine/threonine-protein kinase [Bdellovibrionota bacterium]|jgi:serine/threonine protein kinase